MQRVKTGDSEAIKFKQGGGCVALFGVPFFLAGLFVMLSPLLPKDIQPTDKDTGKPMPIHFALPFGGVFAATGAAFIFGRGGKTLNRRTNEMTTWWGLLVPFKSTTYQLSDFERVTVSRERRKSKNSHYTVFPVRIDGSKPGAVKIDEPKSEPQALELAEELAKFLEIPLIDRTMGEAVRREADQLDESLRDKSVRTGEHVEVGEPPPDLKAQYSFEGKSIIFDFPPTGLKLQHLIFLLPMLIFVSVALFVFLIPILGDEKMPFEMKCFFCGFLGLFFILLPLAGSLTVILQGIKTTSQVVVSPHEIQLTRKGLFRSKTETIPSDELEELRIVKPQHAVASNRKRSLTMILGGELIIARSDKTRIVFGQGLPRDQLEWVKSIVHKVLVS